MNFEEETVTPREKKYDQMLGVANATSKGWLAMCDLKLRVAMCGSKLQCADTNQFFWNLQCACMRCIFRLAKFDHNFARFFSNNARYEDWKCPFFWSKLQFCSSTLRDRIRIKAEITSFDMRYYMNLIKLCLRLWVTTIKKASCAQLRVRRDFGVRSCGCGNSK